MPPRKARRPAPKRKAPAPSTGPFTVGLMALHDRAFFQRLLNDPQGTLTDAVAQGKLSLTTTDIALVARQVTRVPRSAVPDSLAVWDRWQATGQMANPRVEWMDFLATLLRR